MSIFKSCDVRGVYNEQLTPAFARDFGRAVGTVLQGRSVVVGGDARISTPILKGNLVDGLISTGCRVVDLGLTATPVLYYAHKHTNVSGAIMVTASHNPPQYNGFKLMLGERPVIEDDLANIQQIIQDRAFCCGRGFWEHANHDESYRQHILNFFPSLGKLKVIVDGGNGTFSKIVPRALREAGHDVIKRFCQIDGRFPHRDPNPAVAEHITGLAKQVRNDSADLGVAFDGDGDRVVFVDDCGSILPGDIILTLFIRTLLSDRRASAPQTVVYDIKCSSIVEEEITRWRGIPHVERSGHAFIKTSLMKTNARLAGEISGHYFFQELQRDDALFATLLLLDIIAREKRSLSQIITTIPRYSITPDIRIPCPEKRASMLLDDLQSAFHEHSISTVDGVRIDFGDGWALARISVTEPLMTLRFEGKTGERLAQIIREVAAKLPRWEFLREISERDWTSGG